MKNLNSITFVLMFAVYFTSCKNTQQYETQIRELDSLKVVVQQSVANFKLVDSSACISLYEKQYTYLRFIETHVKDTVSKDVALSIQKLQSTEKGINEYLTYRAGWLYEASLSVLQLQNLASDLKNGSIDSKDARTFIENEKQQAKVVIDQLKGNTESVRKHIEATNQSLPEVESFIKKINSDMLPQLIKPENH